MWFYRSQVKCVWCICKRGYADKAEIPKGILKCLQFGKHCHTILSSSNGDSPIAPHSRNLSPALCEGSLYTKVYDLLHSSLQIRRNGRTSQITVCIKCVLRAQCPVLLQCTVSNTQRSIPAVLFLTMYFVLLPSTKLIVKTIKYSTSLVATCFDIKLS
jgi:hypothetical protein